MKVFQPPAPNAPPKAPSPLELAIYQFEQKARAYHQGLALNAPEDEFSEQAKARKTVLERDLEHLQNERTRIGHMVQIQAQLEQYREGSKKKSAEELRKEPYHPTKRLATHLTAVAEPQPSLFHDAHHIIPGKGRWQQLQIMRARLSMHIHGIGIDDPKNGAWLPRCIEHKGHWATPKAPAHREIHRFNYETWIVGKFSQYLPVEAFEAGLRVVKTMLKFGGYPPEITQPKNISWKG